MCCDPPPSLPSSVAPYLDSVVRGVAHVEASPAVDRDAVGELELPVLDPLAPEGADELEPRLVRRHAAVHEARLARVVGHVDAVARHGDAAGQAEVAVADTAPD